MDGVGGGGEGSQTTGIAPLLLWLQRDGVLAVNGWLLAVCAGLFVPVLVCMIVVLWVLRPLVARRDRLVAGAHLRVRERVREQACSAYCFCDRHGHREHDRVEILCRKNHRRKVQCHNGAS